MDAKEVVQRGYDLFGSGDMETFFGEVVHDNITWTFPGEVGKHPLAGVHKGKENFIWGSPKSKNIDYKVEHPVFSKDKNGKPTISYIDQFPEPLKMVQCLFLQRL